MSLALKVMVWIKDFSRKWLVVKTCSFTGSFPLDGYTEYFKFYLLRYMGINFPIIKCTENIKGKYVGNSSLTCL